MQTHGQLAQSLGTSQRDKSTQPHRRQGPYGRLCGVTWSSRPSYVIGLRGKTRAKAI